MDHDILLSQKDNASNISNSLNNFRKLNVIEILSSNLIQITPPNPSDTSHPKYNVKK